MSDQSSIEWTDATWNPVSGCTRVSAGCDHCYAVAQSHMRGANPMPAMQRKYAGLTVLNRSGDRHFNGTVRTDDASLKAPFKWAKGRRVFVNSMSDLFHRDVPFEFIDKVFAVMALCPQHTFQILTKRPERMAEYLNSKSRDLGQGPHLDTGFAIDAAMHKMADGPYSFDECDPKYWPLPNVWLGTSVENQAAADERIVHLLKSPAAVRFLSGEPLLGAVDLDVYLFGESGPGSPRDGHSISWVIVGGESGPGARPMHPDWARFIRDQCVAAGVPFFFKQWGEWRPESSAGWWKSSTEKIYPQRGIAMLRDGRIAIEELPAREQIQRRKVAGQPMPSSFVRDPDALREFDRYCESKGARPNPGYQWLFKSGKHLAGRLLDGRTWDQFPASIQAEVRQ